MTSDDANRLWKMAMRWWRRSSGVDEEADTRRREILDVLANACARAGEGARIRYRTEWLGYLPYGQYRWVDVERGDEKTEIMDLPEEWRLDDLQSLAAAGHLRQLSESREEADRMHEIVYEWVEAG
jgi:hypothetical protein